MIFFVRHGQTDWNAEHRLQAWSDIPLNEIGRRQAAAIRDLLSARDVRFARAATSPLQRAVETAEIILAEQTVTAPAYDALREVGLGDYEGRLEEALRTELGERYQQWRATLFAEPAPGGETRQIAANRVGPIIAELAEAARHDDVLIVGHQAINMVMKSVLAGTDDLETLRGFMQANHQIDMWDIATQSIAERLAVD
ncbi:MAG: histidine phosphatase family protein [Pseudomonadota bacterium]